MANEIDQEEHITAFRQLFQCAADKKYSLRNKRCSYDTMTKTAKQLNEFIKEKNGIDLFLVNDYETITKYEDILGNIFSNYAYSSLLIRDISDDIELLKRYRQISPDALCDSTIRISSTYASYIKKHKRDFRIDDKYLIRMAHKPHFVCKITGLSTSMLITTTKISLMGQDRILLLHLRTMSSEIRRDDLLSLDKIEAGQGFEKLTIVSAMLFSFREFKKYFSNPTRLFLKGLDYYGMDIELNNTIKRLHWNVCFHTIREDPLVFLRKAVRYDGPQPDHFIIPFVYYSSPLACCFEFVYAVNMDSLLQAFKD